VGQNDNGTTGKDVKSPKIEVVVRACKYCDVKFEKMPEDVKDLDFCSHYCRRKLRKM
jgi:hypothetical protein